jgi:hypothetical protein
MRGGATVSLPPVLENLYSYLGALQVSMGPWCDEQAGGGGGEACVRHARRPANPSPHAGCSWRVCAHATTSECDRGALPTESGPRPHTMHLPPSLLPPVARHSSSRAAAIIAAAGGSPLVITRCRHHRCRWWLAIRHHALPPSSLPPVARHSSSRAAAIIAAAGGSPFVITRCRPPCCRRWLAKLYSADSIPPPPPTTPKPLLVERSSKASRCRRPASGCPQASTAAWWLSLSS